MRRTRSVLALAGVLAALAITTAAPAQAQAPWPKVYPCLVPPCPIAD